MRRIPFIVMTLVVLWIAAPASASSWWCAPEYQSCDGGGTAGGGGSSTGGGGTMRDGTNVYGGHYATCTVISTQGGRCWECVYNPARRTNTCGGVSHDAYCECTESVRNYIITSCGEYGSCSYYRG